MAKAVNCPCGETISAETDDELVKLVQAHGKEVHNQEVSREDALAMAQPVEWQPRAANVPQQGRREPDGG